MTRTIAVLLLLVHVGGAAMAQEKKPDDRSDDPKKAEADYDKQVTAARQELLEAIENIVRDEAKSGDLEQVDKLLNDYRLFKTDDRLPTEPKLQSARRKYLNRIEAGIQSVLDTYDRQITGLTKELKLDQAKSARTARDRFEELHLLPDDADESNKRVDLRKIRGLSRSEQYNNPQLPYIYETWSYRMPGKGPRKFKLIHATDGEAFLSYDSGGSRWFQIRIGEDGYFHFWGAPGPENQESYAIFVIKRYRN